MSGPCSGLCESDTSRIQSLSSMHNGSVDPYVIKFS
eukprot:SAG31_NODE_45143_length_260_cov_0.633540_1_plen_35_part_01